MDFVFKLNIVYTLLIAAIWLEPIV